MKEEMEQLNKRFDKLEEMLIQVTEMVLETNEKLEKYAGATNQESENQEQRLQKAESDIKLIKKELITTVQRLNDIDTYVTYLKFR